MSIKGQGVQEYMWADVSTARQDQFRTWWGGTWAFFFQPTLFLLSMSLQADYMLSILKAEMLLIAFHGCTCGCILQDVKKCTPITP